MKGSRVLVTGGAGFIGSHLVKRLVALGADVSVVVKYNSIIDNVRLSSIWKELAIVEADLRNVDSLRQFDAKAYDTIFHLAAYNHVGDSFVHVTEALTCSALGTANLLESRVEYGRFLYISSSEVYGYQAEVPFSEEQMPFPISPYAVGKYAGEVYSQFKQRQTGKAIALIRPFNTFGPYQSDRAVIPELIVKCLLGTPVETTQGNQTREFNYVDNQIDALIMAATHEDCPTFPLNIGSNREVAICDLARMIHDLCESKSELRIGALPDRQTEIWRMGADYTRAQEVLGWRPRVDFEEGLRRTIAWFRKYVDVFYSTSSLNSL